MAMVTEPTRPMRLPGWCRQCNQLQMMYRKPGLSRGLKPTNWECSICGKVHVSVTPALSPDMEVAHGCK